MLLSSVSCFVMLLLHCYHTTLSTQATACFNLRIILFIVFTSLIFAELLVVYIIIPDYFCTGNY